MKGVMVYKDFIGSVEYSDEDGVLYGQVLGVPSLLSYEGTDVTSLRNDFMEMVDEYLEECRLQNRKPEVSYKGSFNVRVSPEVHRDSVIYAKTHDISLNSFVEKAIKKALDDQILG